MSLSVNGDPVVDARTFLLGRHPMGELLGFCRANIPPDRGPSQVVLADLCAPRTRRCADAFLMLRDADCNLVLIDPRVPEPAPR